MIICRKSLLRKRHAAARPIGSEPAGLHARELDAPLGFYFLRNGFGEALDGPLGRAVDGEHGHATLAADGGDLLDDAAGGLLFTHDLHGFAGDGDEAEEIDVHLLVDLGVFELFKGTAEAVAGVVDHDVDAAKLLEGGVEGGGDGGVVGDVEFDGKVVFLRGVFEGEGGGVAGGGDGDVALVEDFLDEVLAEAGGGAGDKEDARHLVSICE